MSGATIQIVRDEPLRRASAIDRAAGGAR